MYVCMYATAVCIYRWGVVALPAQPGDECYVAMGG
eukprot:COSAG06_NODE_50665_length_317_cov_0.711009_1_plen_34_part_01